MESESEELSEEEFEAGGDLYVEAVCQRPMSFLKAQTHREKSLFFSPEFCSLMALLLQEKS